MLRIKQLPTFDSVAAGRKAVVDLPLGLRYHVVWLELGNNAGTALAPVANTLTDLVDDIVVKINGKPQRTHSAGQLNQLNGINGDTYLVQAYGANGYAERRLYLPIYFAEPWRKDQQEVPSMALRTNGIQSFQIEVNVKAGLDKPVVGGWYEFDYDNRDIGVISKCIRQDYSAVGTTRDITTVDKRDFIESIHLFPLDNAGDGLLINFVSEVKLTANGEEIRDRITYLQNRASLIGRELVPDTLQWPRFDLIFDYDDPVTNALPTQVNGRPINELTLKLTWSQAANTTQTAIIKRSGLIE
jgi:hypothetical protein